VATFEALLILLATILLSSIINQFLPRFSVPIVQLVLGIVIALIFPHFNIRFEPEMLMLVLIAPLLFNEARKADRRALWRLKWPIIGLAVGLVIVETVAVGFLLNYLVAGLSLAAAFALAAALSPTDSVAVSALSERTSIPSHSEQMLTGEALINDASGIIAFQFALAAVLTRQFSAFGATQHFLFVFIGGLVVGALFGIGRALFVHWVRSIGLEDITFHIIVELLTPFLAFLIAEALGVSGILAVVAAGFGVSFRNRRRSTPATARQRLVSTSVWEVVSFILNGLVFLLLGTELPSALRAILTEGKHGTFELIAYILVATVALYALRALWVTLMTGARRLSKRGRRQLRKQQREGRSRSRSLREVLTFTFAGARGAVALGVALTIPVMIAPGKLFPERSLIIFIAAGVIVLTLLVANFLLPILAPAQTREMSAEETQAILQILHRVITRLSDERTDANRIATEMVIRNYQTRIQELEEHISNIAVNKLRLRALNWEEEHTQQRAESGEISVQLSLLTTQQIRRARSFVTRRAGHGWLVTLLGLLLRRSHITQRKKQKDRELKRQQKNPQLALKEQRALAEANRELRLENYRFAAEQLEKMLVSDSASDSGSDSPAEPATDPAADRITRAVLDEYRRRIERLEGVQTRLADQAIGDELQKGADRLTAHAREHTDQRLDPDSRDGRGNGSHLRVDLEQEVSRITARGLELELEGINQAVSDELLSQQAAKELRDNVAFMELDLQESA